MARLRPFFKYYGSKFNLAPKYPKPQHDRIIEPFAGSAQYATLHYTHGVVLYERDLEIAYLWHWLTKADACLIRALPYDIPTGTDIREVTDCVGAQLLIRAWQHVGRSDCWTISKWNNANSGFWSERTREAIASQVSAIRHWEVMGGSCGGGDPREMLLGTWFIDPPYQSQPKVYGGDPPDFHQLGSWCRSRRGQTIVCEAPGADWLPFRPLAENTVGRTSQGGTRARRTEMIWTND